MSGVSLGNGVSAIDSTTAVNFATAQYQSNIPTSPSRPAPYKLYETNSVFDMAATNIPGDTWDATAALTYVNTLSKRVIYVPRGVHQITSNITLTGYFRFDSGAVLQPASGVTVTFTNCRIDAGQYDQIFDTSLGGTFTGTIRNKTYSVCWFGADWTGTTSCGTQINTALAAKLTPIMYVPYGTYNHNGVMLEINGIIVQGDENARPYFYCSSDMGSGTYAAELINCPAIENIIFAGPGGNGSVAYGTTKVNMDGAILGGIAGVGSQTKFTKVLFTNYRYGIVFNETGGHVWFNTCSWLGNYASICVLQTGGDYIFEDCDSQVERLCCFYFPRNGSMGANWAIRGRFYYRQMPWFICQDTVDDTRSPYPAGTTKQMNAGIGRWENINGELIGNGFMCALPTDSYLNNIEFYNPGWASGNSAYNATTGNFQRLDYTFIVGIPSYITITCTGGGVNWTAPGTAGIIGAQNGGTVIFDGLVYNLSTMVGKYFAYQVPHKYLRPLLYTPSFLNIPSGTTSMTYTMSQLEMENMSSDYGFLATIVPRLNQAGFLPPYRLSTSGYTLTVTFQTATTSQVYATLNLCPRPG